MTYTRRGLPASEREIFAFVHSAYVPRAQIAKHKRRCGRDCQGQPLLRLSAVTALLLPAVNNVTHRSRIARREISHCAIFSLWNREAGAVAFAMMRTKPTEVDPRRAVRPSL